MLQVAISIARFTLIEALRTRVLLVVIALIGIAALAAEFSASLAITDSQSYRTGVYAALARAGSVLIMVLFVATSVARELQDRMLDLTLSRPVSRASWFLGRLAGFFALALCVAGLSGLPLMVSATPLHVLYWAASLAAELCLIVCACLACIVTLRQVTLAVTATAAFYLLGRVMDAIVLMSKGPTVDPTSWATPTIARAVELIALVVPALDRFTRAAWLGLDAAPSELGGVLAQALIYSLLLIAVGLFDVYRMND